MMFMVSGACKQASVESGRPLTKAFCVAKLPRRSTPCWIANADSVPRLSNADRARPATKRSALPFAWPDWKRYQAGMAQAELSETVHALLRATAELSREQSLLDQDPERTTAPRDHATQKAVAAFREFEAGAKASKLPLT